MTDTDIAILQAFLHFKGQYYISPDARKLIDAGFTLNSLRKLAIINNRFSLVSTMIGLEWSEASIQSSFLIIDNLIESYLLKRSSRKMFIFMFNTFQSYIIFADDILYYLNPLKYIGREIDAINSLIVDPTLDYSEFISECQAYKLDHDVIQSLIKRTESPSD